VIFSTLGPEISFIITDLVNINHARYDW